MGISVREAAEQTGLSKAAIFKAIRTGKVSAQKDEQGQWEIQPVELFRVYTPVHSYSHSQVNDGTQQSVREDIAGTQRENELLRQMVRDKDDVIADLRQRLDAESDERRRLTALLEALTPPRTAAPRSWWARLLGGGE